MTMCLGKTCSTESMCVCLSLTFINLCACASIPFGSAGIGCGI